MKVCVVVDFGDGPGPKGPDGKPMLGGWWTLALIRQDDGLWRELAARGWKTEQAARQWATLKYSTSEEAE